MTYTGYCALNVTSEYAAVQPTSRLTLLRVASGKFLQKSQTNLLVFKPNLLESLMKCTLAVLVVLVARASVSASSLPEVNLGYVRQRATEYNSTTGIYVYKNIRYARPPVGELRFRKPRPPLQEPAGTISDGTQYSTTICPQPSSNATPSANGYSEDCLVSSLSCGFDVTNHRTSSSTFTLQEYSNMAMISQFSCGFMVGDTPLVARMTYTWYQRDYFEP